MPEMGGYGFMEAVRNHGNSLIKKIPILLFTHLQNHEEVIESMRRDFGVYYLNKLVTHKKGFIDDFPTEIAGIIQSLEETSKP